MGRAGRPKGQASYRSTRSAARRQKMLELREALSHLRPLPNWTHRKGRKTLLREKDRQKIDA